MLIQIKGLYYVIFMVVDVQVNSDFFIKMLGFCCVKKIVNFDVLEVYYFYYGDEVGIFGLVMIYFFFFYIVVGKVGVGEVGEIYFVVFKGLFGYWCECFGKFGVQGFVEMEVFGEK